MRPLIGITGRRLKAAVIDRADDRFSDRLIDVFWADFPRCVAAAGGIPIHVPFTAAAAGVVSRLDGLIITGGQDVCPNRWGGDDRLVDLSRDPRRDPMAPDPERDQYELDLVYAALVQGTALLGVCRGHQVINVALGGTLIPDLVDAPLTHNRAEPAPSDGSSQHVISFLEGSLAASLYGPTCVVNSWHHQAINACGEGLLASGHASDGTIEAVELLDRPVLGLQWHPEWRPDLDPVFPWLINAARRKAPAARGAPASEPSPTRHQARVATVKSPEGQAPPAETSAARGGSLGGGTGTSVPPR